MSQITGILGTLTLLAGAVATGIWAVSSYTGPATDGPVAVDNMAPATAPRQSLERVLPAPRPDVFYQAITDRPLFAPNRRPVAAATAIMTVEEVVPEEPVTAAQRPDGLVLGGVLDGTDRRSAFIVIEGADGAWFQKDDLIQGWAITDITPDAITLANGDDSFRLELFE